MDHKICAHLGELTRTGKSNDLSMDAGLDAHDSEDHNWITAAFYAAVKLIAKLFLCEESYDVSPIEAI